jgi:hypothetical protein
MLKTVAAGAAALMIAAGAIAYAQQPPGPEGGGRRAFAAEDRAAFLEARIAALHAGLRLTAEQEKAWPALEEAYRELAALHGHHPGPAAQGTGNVPGSDEVLDPVQRIQRRAEALTARGAALKRYADALAPLYGSFDDGQKRRFGVLSHGGHHHFHHFAWRDRGEFGDRGEYGPRREFAPRRRFGEGGERGEFGPLRAEFGPPRAEFDDRAAETEEFSPAR